MPSDSRARASRHEQVDSGSRRVGTAIIGLIVLAALVPRVIFHSRWGINFDPDEALLGLQAREFLQGRFPIFFPGQSYMGSLQALLAAPFLALFGNHPASLRISPLLWVVPGLAAILALERLGNGPLARGRGAAMLAVSWCFPPVTLALASVKARGGSLEMLVLGLWSLVLVWPRSPGLSAESTNADSTPLVRETMKSRAARAGAAGVLLGVALWTQIQAGLFLPLAVGALWFSSRRRSLELALFLLGLTIGYLPLWLPRAAPLLVGPPGVEGTLYRPAVENLFDPEVFLRFGAIVSGTTTTQQPVLSATTLPEAAYLTMILLVSLLALVPTARAAFSGSTRKMQSRGDIPSPAFLITGWIALASTLIIAATPVLFEDSQWFRYLVPVAPLLVVLQARGLSRLPPRAGWILAAAISLASGTVLLRNGAGWLNTDIADPDQFIQQLDDQGADRVVTSWEVAYPIRFWSEDRILATASGVPRYPEVAAQVEFAPRAWRLLAARHSEKRTVRVVERRENPPPDVARAFADLNLTRTLFPQYEPYPLFAPDWYPRDWRGWPPRRSLLLFDHIVWMPALAPSESLRDSIASAIAELERSGQFVPFVDWKDNRILRRVR